MLIKDLVAGGHINLQAEIIEIQPIRRTWKCFDCQKKGKIERNVSFGVWAKPEEFRDNCPTCGVKETKKKGEGLWVRRVTSALIKDESGRTYLDLWDDDVDRFKVGDKIQLVEGYAKKKETEGYFVSTGMYGSIAKL